MRRHSGAGVSRSTHLPFPSSMHRSLRGALRLAALLVPTTAAAAQAPTAAAAGRAAVVARIDSLGRSFVAEGKAPSASIAVVRGARDTLLLRAYGLANVEKKTPATPATVYRIGSVTKQFTSSLVMRLVERGVVRLDDPISRHLSGLPAAWQPIPIRQLLNHTSGTPCAPRVDST